MIDKEKLRELAEELAGCYVDEYEAEITHWLEQNQPSPVVVGLSDEKVEDYIKYWSGVDNIESFKRMYEQWAKTQTFAQQTLQPNWDDAPKWANWLAQDKNGQWFWYELKPTLDLCAWEYQGKAAECYIKDENWQQTLQHRPNPPVKVEVGQVWKDDDFETVRIVAITLIEDVPYVVFETEFNQYYLSYSMKTFLAKFERI